MVYEGFGPQPGFVSSPGGGVVTGLFFSGVVLGLKVTPRVVFFLRSDRVVLVPRDNASFAFTFGGTFH